MQAQMVTSKDGGELVSFKVNGKERIHQGDEKAPSGKGYEGR